MFRLLTEMVFMLAGLLLLWVGLTGRFLFDARQPSWLVLAMILIVWGAQAWRRAGLIALRGVRLAGRLAGASLVVVGLVMLSLAWAPLLWVGRLLVIAGAVFVVRGLVSAAVSAAALAGGNCAKMAFCAAVGWKMDGSVSTGTLFDSLRLNCS